MVRQIVVGTIASAAFGIALHAECVGLPAKEMMSRPGVELIFAGRVVDVQDVGQSAARWTIEVERVWKGSVPARIDIYSSRFGPSEVRPPFRKGGNALVLAARISDVKQWRQFYGLSESDPPTEYRAYGCLDALEPNFEANLGPSHPPKK